jgi:hypothetical protein
MDWLRRVFWAERFETRNTIIGLALLTSLFFLAFLAVEGEAARALVLTAICMGILSAWILIERRRR